MPDNYSQLYKKPYRIIKRSTANKKIYSVKLFTQLFYREMPTHVTYNIKNSIPFWCMPEMVSLYITIQNGPHPFLDIAVHDDI